MTMQILTLCLKPLFNANAGAQNSRAHAETLERPEMVTQAALPAAANWYVHLSHR